MMWLVMEPLLVNGGWERPQSKREERRIGAMQKCGKVGDDNGADALIWPTEIRNGV
jgi:hypothetical protein